MLRVTVGPVGAAHHFQCGSRIEGTNIGRGSEDVVVVQIFYCYFHDVGNTAGTQTVPKRIKLARDVDRRTAGERRDVMGALQPLAMAGIAFLWWARRARPAQAT